MSRHAGLLQSCASHTGGPLEEPAAELLATITEEEAPTSPKDELVPSGKEELACTMSELEAWEDDGGLALLAKEDAPTLDAVVDDDGGAAEDDDAGVDVELAGASEDVRVPELAGVAAEELPELPLLEDDEPSVAAPLLHATTPAAPKTTSQVPRTHTSMLAGQGSGPRLEK